MSFDNYWWCYAIRVVAFYDKLCYNKNSPFSRRFSVFGRTVKRAGLAGEGAAPILVSLVVWNKGHYWKSPRSFSNSHLNVTKVIKKVGRNAGALWQPSQWRTLWTVLFMPCRVTGRPLEPLITTMHWTWRLCDTGHLTVCFLCVWNILRRSCGETLSTKLKCLSTWLPHSKWGLKRHKNRTSPGINCQHLTTLYFEVVSIVTDLS